MPQSLALEPGSLLGLRHSTLKVGCVPSGCTEQLRAALNRLVEHLKASAPSGMKALQDAADSSSWEAWGGDGGSKVDVVRLEVKNPEAPLVFNVTEEYSIQLSAPTVLIKAPNQYGALHALTTLAQLAAPNTGGKRGQPSHWIPRGRVRDAPRFPHRGLLVDTARHYLPVEALAQTLDAMSWSKLNVLHWHLADDQSFPWASAALPRLARAGAYHPGATYSAQDIASVRDYAASLGIRVMVELDTPGHTASWAKGHPELVVPCRDDKGAVIPGEVGPLDPSKEATYDAVGALLGELAGLLPDALVHVGGDEVDPRCWASDPQLKQWMDAQGIKTFEQLQGAYMDRVLGMVQGLNRTAVVWQEVYDAARAASPAATAAAAAGAQPGTAASGGSRQGRLGLHPDTTIVHVWKTGQGHQLGAGAESSQQHRSSNAVQDWHQQGARASRSRRLAAAAGTGSRQGSTISHAAATPVTQPGSAAVATAQGASVAAGEARDLPWAQELGAVVTAGYRALLSAPWYLDWISWGEDWVKYYTAEPLSFSGTREQYARVLGGEACMWGEYVDAANLHSRTWPRAAAVAERLWSAASITDVASARLRLRAHRCRMVARGLPAGPVGPGHCVDGVEVSDQKQAEA